MQKIDYIAGPKVKKSMLLMIFQTDKSDMQGYSKKFFWNEVIIIITYKNK